MVRIRPGTGGSDSDSGGSGGGGGTSTDSTQDRDRRRERRRDTVIGDDGGGGGGGGGSDGGDDTDFGQPGQGGGLDRIERDIGEGGGDGGMGDVGTGPGSDRNVGQIRDGQRDGGTRTGYDPLEPAQPRDTSDIMDAQRFAQRRQQARFEAFDERQRELATEDFRDVQEFSQRRAQARAEAFNEWQRELATDDFRDVQELGQRRAVARAEQAQDLNRQIAEQLGVPVSIISRGDDYTIDDEGNVELTAEGRQTAIEAQAVEEGEIGVQREAGAGAFSEVFDASELSQDQIAALEERVDGELVFNEQGDITGIEESIDIQTTDQLTFGEGGDLTDVRRFRETEAAEQAARQELASSVPLVGGAVSDFAFSSQDFVEGFGEVSTDVGTALWEGRDIPGTDVQVGLEPAAEVAGDAQELLARTTDLANPLDDETVGENAAQFLGSAGDVARGEEDEIGAQTFTETATEKVAGGGLETVRMGVELPQTVATGTELTGQAGAFAAQNPLDESVGAAGGVVIGAGERVIRQTTQNPFRTAGTLLGSGAVMGGAAAVSSRAGLGTRLAIQPGEELIGYGGAGTLRRLPGDRTTRAADRLFPNNEPVFMSEETAIRVGQRAGSGLRSAGGRVTSRVGSGLGVASGRLRFDEFVASERGQLQQGLTRSESGGETRSDVTGEIAGTSPEPGVLPGNEGAGVDTGEAGGTTQMVGGEAFPTFRDAELPEGHPLRSDTEADPVDTELVGREATERLEEAQRPFWQTERGTVRRETTFGDLPLADERAVTGDMVAELEAAQEPSVRPDQEIRSWADVGTESLLGTESEQETDIFSETETRTDTEAETETETETDTRVRLRPEVEVESETETEFELELRGETEQEVEGEPFFEEEEQRDRRGFNLFASDATFGSGIASAEDILGNGNGNGDNIL